MIYRVNQSQVGHSIECAYFHTAEVLTLINEFIIIKNMITFGPRLLNCPLLAIYIQYNELTLTRPFV